VQHFQELSEYHLPLWLISFSWSKLCTRIRACSRMLSLWYTVYFHRWFFKQNRLRPRLLLVKYSIGGNMYYKIIKIFE